MVQRAGGVFAVGPRNRNPGAAVGAQITARIRTKVKEAAAANVFKAAPAIVNEILMAELTNAPCPSLPRPEHLARTVNRCGQKL